MTEACKSVHRLPLQIKKSGFVLCSTLIIWIFFPFWRLQSKLFKHWFHKQLLLSMNDWFPARNNFTCSFEDAIAFTQFCDYLLKQIITVTAGVMTTVE